MKRTVLLLAVIILLLAVGSNQGYFNIPRVSPWPQVETPPIIPGQKVIVKSEESLIVEAVKKALPSVVTVSMSKTTRTQDVYQFDPFNPFSPPQIKPGQEQKVEGSIGSGFVADSKGIIITNKHVVADTDATYKIVTNDNKTYSVEHIFRDPLNDLAIIQVKAENLTPLALADSDKLQLGQIAIAIGTPLGEFQNAVTSGIVSGLGRGITAGSPYEGYVEKLDNVIQTDAAINAGNSGGPLLNSAGQVIGINTAVSQEGQNIGFAIPVNVVKEVLNNFNTSGGKISRPFLGVRYKVLDEKTAVMNDLVAGAYITEVVRGSNAEKAGLRAGDVIVKINNHKITEANDISNVVKNEKVGSELKLEVWRKGKKQTLNVTLGEYE